MIRFGSLVLKSNLFLSPLAEPAPKSN